MIGAVARGCQIAFACLIGVGAAMPLVQAGEVYRWRDGSGLWHFTDDPSKVPPRYRKGAVRRLPARDVAGSASGVSARTSSGGEVLWRSKCASCHFLDGNGLRKDGKRGLRRFILNPDTGFPFGPDRIVPRLRRAADGRTSDMPPVSITEEEMNELVAYLISRFK